MNACFSLDPEPTPRLKDLGAGHTDVCPRHALGSWSEFGKMVPHTLVASTYASPLSWTRYSHSDFGALPKSPSEKLTGPNSPLAL